MQINYAKPRRKTIDLDESIIKKLRTLQAELITAENRNISFSEVLELVLLEKLKM